MPSTNRLLRRIAAGVSRRMVFFRARLSRRRRKGVTYVAVTGSAGKTTAKDLIAALLAKRMTGRANVESRNDNWAVAMSILSLSRTDRFCVQEIGINPYQPDPGIDSSLRLFRPDVAVITNVTCDHVALFPKPEDIAREKSKAVAALSDRGVAVLNYDDPQVRAMDACCAGRVVTYGRSAGASVRAENVRSAWPERLSFRLVHGSQAYEVQTQLCGAHWVDSVLAAAATAVAMSVPLELFVEAAATYSPVAGRMSPELHEDGVTFIRDDWKSGMASVRPTLDFMREARAARKILIIGSLTHMIQTPAEAYAETADLGMQSADFVFFVGSFASEVLGARTDPNNHNLRVFHTVKALSEFLRSFLTAGDLVMVKGHHSRDHLERIVLARRNHVACWAPNCGNHWRCYECPLQLVAVSDTL